MPRIEITDEQMSFLEKDGKAEVLFRDAAQEEFGKVFGHTRPNQLVARVFKYYRHTNYGFEEVPAHDLKESR